MQNDEGGGFSPSINKWKTELVCVARDKQQEVRRIATYKGRILTEDLESNYEGGRLGRKADMQQRIQINRSP